MDARTQVAHWLLRALSAALLFVALACGGSEDGDDPVGVLGIDDGASNGVATSALVRGDRDVTLKLKTGAGVLVPAGAVKSEVNVTIRRPKDADAQVLVASLGAGRKIASAPYVFTPHGQTFEKDVRIALPVAEAARGKRLSVAWLENETDTRWKVLGPGEPVSNTVVVPIKHFSVLVLVEGDLTSEDVGPGPGIDMGIDGGTTTGDGGMDFPDVPDETRDASGGAPGIDASVELPPDSGPAVVDGSVRNEYSERLFNRFEECGLISREGEFEFVPPTFLRPDERCYLECLTTVECTDLQFEWCREATTNPLIECFGKCLGLRADVCPDQSGIFAVYCDGREECARGVDELQCPAGSSFQCGDGQRLPPSARCDGYIDCLDAEDEVRCDYPANFFTCMDGSRLPPDAECDGDYDCELGEDEANCQGRLFACEDGALVINANYVCNGIPDCYDGSDEPERCMAVNCQILTTGAVIPVVGDAATQNF